MVTATHPLVVCLCQLVQEAVLGFSRTTRNNEGIHGNLDRLLRQVVPHQKRDFQGLTLWIQFHALLFSESVVVRSRTKGAKRKVRGEIEE